MFHFMTFVNFVVRDVLGELMKYVDEFRDGPACLKVAEAVKKIATKPWVLMEICGGQTHSIARYGIEDLLPPKFPWCTARVARFA